MYKKERREAIGKQRYILYDFLAGEYSKQLFKRHNLLIWYTDIFLNWWFQSFQITMWCLNIFSNYVLQLIGIYRKKIFNFLTPVLLLALSASQHCTLRANRHFPCICSTSNILWSNFALLFPCACSLHNLCDGKL